MILRQGCPLSAAKAFHSCAVHDLLEVRTLDVSRLKNSVAAHLCRPYRDVVGSCAWPRRGSLPDPPAFCRGSDMVCSAEPASQAPARAPVGCRAPPSRLSSLCRGSPACSCGVCRAVHLQCYLASAVTISSCAMRRPSGAAAAATTSGRRLGIAAAAIISPAECGGACSGGPAGNHVLPHCRTEQLAGGAVSHVWRAPCCPRKRLLPAHPQS